MLGKTLGIGKQGLQCRQQVRRGGYQTPVGLNIWAMLDAETACIIRKEYGRPD
jgi:hypothetical protein